MDATEQSSENQKGNEQLTSLSYSKDSSTITQNAEQHVVTTPEEIPQRHLSPLQPHYLKKGWCETNKQMQYISH